MGFFALLVFYWIAVAALFFIGLIMIIVNSSKNESTKTGIKLLIGSAIMLVIGLGACAVILGVS